MISYNKVPIYFISGFDRRSRFYDNEFRKAKHSYYNWKIYSCEEALVKEIYTLSR